FTGKKLADYDYLVTTNPAVPGYKYYASRAIVNGDTADNGAKIATYSQAFEKALGAAGYKAEKMVLGIAPEPSKTSTSSPKTSDSGITLPPPVQAPPAPSGNWLAALISALAHLFKGKQA